MNLRSAALGTLLGLSACDGFADGRVQRLEEEVQALRAGQVAAPADVAAAMAPLRGAMDVLVQRGEVERTRWAALAQEIGQLATLVHGFVDDGRRAEVEALRARIGDLERQAQEQAKAQGDDRELLLRALEATATRLEAFLRQVSPRKGESAPLPVGNVDLWRSLRQPQVLWPLGLAMAAAATLLWLSRRGRRSPLALALDPPDAVVDAPAPMVSPAVSQAGGARGFAGDGPVMVRLDVRASDVDQAAQRLTTWLEHEPRVLRRPVPAVEPGAGVLRVCFFVPGTMSAAERASLTAEVGVRGRSESHADRRSA